MEHELWMILNWTGTPLPGNAAHTGWSRIDWFTMDSDPSLSRNGGRTGKGGAFSIGIRLDGSSVRLIPQLRPGSTFDRLAVDIVTPEGKWIRNEFSDASVESSGAADSVNEFGFNFGSLQSKSATIQKR